MSGLCLLVYDEGYLKYDFGAAHSMRQERIKLARELISGLGILRNSNVRELPAELVEEEILLIHSEDYVEAVKSSGRDPEGVGWSYMQYGLGTMDNPVFPEMYEASALHVGGTLKATRNVLAGETVHAFNLGGGFHHASRSRASGFCIFNDVAIAIKDLLEEGVRRVLYVDVDAHHGDGVQYAFYSEPRVMTISLHEDGRYLFPGTGFVRELGEGEGEGYSVNVPLPPYTDDEAYQGAFQEVVLPLADAYEPEVLVTQLGVDTHFQDPLTHLNLTTGAYRRIAEEFHRLAHSLCDGKWVATGGGGYDPSAVARSWTLMFGGMAGWEVEDRIPKAWFSSYEALMGRRAQVSTLLDSEGPSKPGIRREVDRVIEEVKQVISSYHSL
ncbi:MAG: acetoin utilization protein AcuC [Thermoplasmata archaeon]